MTAQDEGTAHVSVEAGIDAARPSDALVSFESQLESESAARPERGDGSEFDGLRPDPSRPERTRSERTREALEAAAPRPTREPAGTTPAAPPFSRDQLLRRSLAGDLRASVYLVRNPDLFNALVYDALREAGSGSSEPTAGAGAAELAQWTTVARMRLARAVAAARLKAARETAAAQGGGPNAGASSVKPRSGERTEAIDLAEVDAQRFELERLDAEGGDAVHSERVHAERTPSLSGARALERADRPQASTQSMRARFARLVADRVLAARMADVAPTPGAFASAPGAGAAPTPAEIDRAARLVELRELLQEARLAHFHRVLGQVRSAEELGTTGTFGAFRSELQLGALDPMGGIMWLVDVENRFAGAPVARMARLLRAETILDHGQGLARLEGLAARLLYDLTAAPEVPIRVRAGDVLWRLQNLRVAHRVPELCGSDADGNQVRLSQFVGRVVLLRFWSGESGHDGDTQALDALREDARLEASLGDHPFAVVGVNGDIARSTYLRIREHRAFPGVQIYEGPLDEDVAFAVRERRNSRPSVFDAWRRDHGNAVFLIDANGVLRAINPDPARIEVLVRQLIHERYEATRFQMR